MPTPTSRLIQLVDGRITPRALITATLIRDYPATQLDSVEKLWTPARGQITDSEHVHWDWRNKASSVEDGRNLLIAVECEGEVQGLMAVLTEIRPSELELAIGPVLYVDYLESAPWNSRDFPKGPRILGIGTVMIAEAVILSREMGYKGRVGLHSLPQSEKFYQDRCRMTRLGPDAGYFGLVYFEYTEQQAADWLVSVGLG
jgi:hypothetical protein